MALLKDKVAVITGGGSGIGQGIAEMFAREGAQVAVGDLDYEAAKLVANDISCGGRRAMPVAMDVADEDQVESGISSVVSGFGRIDILVSNAGIQYIAPLVDLDFASWRRMLTVHLDGAFLTTRSCLRHMYSSNAGGSIIYIGSVHSKEASPLKGPYVTAKHGIVGLCKVVAREGAAHNVRANVVCPGFVRTPLVDRQIPEQAAAFGMSEDDVIRKVMLKDTVDGEFTTVVEVAGVILMLAAFPSNALTGQSIVVSHGWFMQ
jgi:3-hydroxybutyrate dehydrogenase